MAGRGRGGPRPAADVRDFTDPDRIDVQAREPFTVLLSDNGPGGYLWRVADVPAELRLRREDDVPPGELVPGASGQKLFELETSEPGTFTLRFERRRDWEPGADRVRTVVVHVAAG